MSRPAASALRNMYEVGRVPIVSGEEVFLHGMEMSAVEDARKRSNSPTDEVWAVWHWDMDGLECECKWLCWQGEAYRK